jgi:hypothetical protein
MGRWKRSGGALALLGLLAVGGCTHAPPAQREIAAADDLLRSGKPERAATRYRRAIDAASTSGDLRAQAHATYELASLYSTYPQLEREQEGLELFEKALALCERAEGLRAANTGAVAYAAAQAYEVQGHWTQAASHYDEALAIFTASEGSLGASAASAAQGYQRALARVGEALPPSALALRARAGGKVEAAAAAPSRPARSVDPGATYLRPNVEDARGQACYVHVGPGDMPLRVSVPRPPTSPKDGSTTDGRQAVIEGMQLWETALAPALPWFRLEFVEDDADAPVQVVWKRRMGGDAAGRGGIRYWSDASGLRVGGEMTLAMQPHAPFSTARLGLEEVHLLVAHEFGHVLGLGHCLDCDSAMNYRWETRERIYVTELDVLTFRALVEQLTTLRPTAGGFVCTASASEAR